MIRKKYIFILIAALLLFNHSYSQTFVSGGIFSNTNWNIAGSPYIVTDTIIVFTGVTLTISPGVIVKFNDGTGMEIRGNLIANGTQTDSITFTSSSTNPAMGIWYGINLTNSSSYNFINMLYAGTGFNIPAVSLAINNSRFYRNNIGINDLTAYFSSDSSYINNSIFENNYTAVSNVYRADYITNCSFTNNVVGLGAVYMSPISDCSFIGNSNFAIKCDASSFYNNTFRNNNIAFQMHSFGSTIVQNNIIVSNNYGFQVIGDASSLTHSIKNNTICNNTIYNIINQFNVSIDFEDNCWCGIDSLAIANSIYDAHDDLSLGIIDFSPFQSLCFDGINDIVNEDSFLIYPNPSSDFITIETPANEGNSELTVYNISGQQILKQKINNTKILVNIEGLNLGIYFLKVRNKNGIAVKKFTKQ